MAELQPRAPVCPRYDAPELEEVLILGSPSEPHLLLLDEALCPNSYRAECSVESQQQRGRHTLSGCWTPHRWIFRFGLALLFKRLSNVVSSILHTPDLY
jgi:hypothetical protein